MQRVGYEVCGVPESTGLVDALGYEVYENGTCQNCEAPLCVCAEHRERWDEGLPDVFCSWRCAWANMKGHDEAFECPCDCDTCSITREAQ